MTRIGIILGSTRPNRKGAQVAEWVHKIAADRDDADFELVDLRDHALPHLDEPVPAMFGRYDTEHARAWSSTISSYDGFVFVTAEYNRGLPGALKTAIDFLFAEWRDKAVGLVSYGVDGGVSAALQLRQLCGVLGMADVSRHLTLTLREDFADFQTFQPTDGRATQLKDLLDEVVAWSTALATLR